MFSLPTKPTLITNCLPNPPHHQTSIPTTSPYPPTDSTNAAATSPHATMTTASLTCFLPTEEEVMIALTHTSSKDATTMNAFIISELCNTFGSEEKADVAYDYLTAFVLLINQQTPGLLRRQLTDYKAMVIPKALHTHLELLLHAG
jgi:hypothetical protein